MRWLCCLAALALAGCVVYDRPAVARPADPPLSGDEARRLLAAGVSAGVMWDLVDRRGVEPLGADAVAALKTAGAPDPLLQKMILAVRTPVPPEELEVIYGPDDYYYGHRPFYTSVGFGFSSWHGSRHVCRPASRGIRVYR